MAVSTIEVESLTFPPEVKPPGSTTTMFLGGAGVRGVEIQGNFIKVTAIGVYMEESAVPWLAAKWTRKTAEELMASPEFFTDIVTGPFEKFYQVTMIQPLTGPKFSEKVMDNCVSIMKSNEAYTDAEAQAVDKFLEVFKDQICPPGFSIFYSQSPTGSLTVSFSRDGSVPEESTATIENKPLSEAVLDSIIGTNGVSPAAKQSLAQRMSGFFKESPWGKSF